MSEQLCPRCRAPVPTGATYCLQCGAPMKVSPGRVLLVVLAALLLFLLGLPALLVGACALMSLGSGATGWAGGLPLLSLLGAAAIAGLLMWFFAWALKGIRR